MDTSGIDADGLQALLTVPSREVLERFFESAFRFRHDASTLPSTASAKQLQVPEAKLHQVCTASTGLIRRVLYDSSDIQNKSSIENSLPSSIDSRLKTLLAEIVFKALPRWRDAAVDQRIGLPRLETVSWRVGTSTAGDGIASANEPVVDLRLSVRQQPVSTAAMPGSKDIDVKIDAAALGSLVASMRKVRDQLAALHG